MHQWCKMVCPCLTQPTHRPSINYRPTHYALSHSRALHHSHKHKLHDATMATPRTITPSSISPPTVGRWPPNLFQSLPHVDSHQRMRRQLQYHSRFRVRSRQPSRQHKFTISTSRDLVQFAVRPFHLHFQQNHFPSLSNIWGKHILRFS